MSSLVPILLFIISTSLTPGPNNCMLMNSGLNFGPKRSIPHFLGVGFGFIALILLAALGLGATFEHYPWIQTALKYVGSAYMVYLAWRISRASNTSAAFNAQQAKPWGFWRAFCFQWINPKVWIMIVGVTSMFTLSHYYFTNAIIISLLYSVIYFPAGGLWLFLGAKLNHILKNDLQRKLFNQVMAICLLVSVLLIFIE